jgi:hypothetical protein
VNHIDGDKTNNSVSNLERCTHRENARHAWRTGLLLAPPHKIGAANGRALIDEAMVLNIRDRLSAGDRPTDLAAELGVSRNTVFNIKYRRKWKHLLLAPPA